MILHLIINAIALTLILNPLEAAIVLLSLKEDYSKFPQTALKTSIYVFLISLCVTYASSFVFFNLRPSFLFDSNTSKEYFGAIKVIGGIILFFVGWIMVNGKRASSFVLSKKEHKAAREKEDISFIPLAVPVIIGPGVFTTLIVLGERARSLNQYIQLFFVILISVLIIYFSLRYAKVIIEFLGIHGVNIVSRLTGIFIMIISVLFFVEGVKELFGG